MLRMLEQRKSKILKLGFGLRPILNSNCSLSVTDLRKSLTNWEEKLPSKIEQSSRRKTSLERSMTSTNAWGMRRKRLLRILKSPVNSLSRKPTNWTSLNAILRTRILSRTSRVNSDYSAPSTT
jgi:hypothetical protein